MAPHYTEYSPLAGYFPPVAVEIREEKRSALDPAEVSHFSAQLAVRLLQLVERGQRQRAPIGGRKEFLSLRHRQHHDVQRRRTVLDVHRNAAAAGDLETERVAVERGTRLLVVALQRAVRERLRHIAASREIGRRKLALPVRPCDGPPFGRGPGIVVLDLEGVAARLAEVDRVGEVLRMRLRYAFDAVLRLVRVDVTVRSVDFLRTRDPNAVVVVVRLVGRVGTALVQDEAPGGVGMLDRRLSRRPGSGALDHPHREEVGEYGERLVERAALEVAVCEPHWPGHPR